MASDAVAVLLDALHCAADAHGFHELDLGHADAAWPQWYAQHMEATLRERGYRLVDTRCGHTVLEPE
jgi:hypothetical protein